MWQVPRRRRHGGPLAGLIIHGKGTGALRKGIHEYLRRHRNVESFQFADITEGGTGATVVTLK